MSDRHTVRADWHDYNGGIYFVTICSHDKKHIFGAIKNGGIAYSSLGGIVNRCLSAIPDHHNDVELLNYVVMPNHIHMLLAVGAQYFAPDTPAPSVTSSIGCLKPPRHGEPCVDNHFNSRLAVIVRSFKAACSIEINRHRRAQNIAPLLVWQRNYHEHIIRNRRAYENIMAYIDSNVANWATDRFN